MNEWVREWVNEWVNEWESERVREWVSGYVMGWVWGKCVRRTRSALSVPQPTMFIPIASPVLHTKRRNASLPAACTRAASRWTYGEVAANARCKSEKLALSATQSTRRLTESRESISSAGPREIPSFSTIVFAPPFNSKREREKGKIFYQLNNN